MTNGVSWYEGPGYGRRDKGSLADLQRKVNNHLTYHSMTAGFSLTFLCLETAYQGRDRREWPDAWFERLRSDDRRQDHLSQRGHGTRQPTVHEMNHG